MKKLLLFVSFIFLYGCVSNDAVKPLPWEQQQAYMSKVRDPRVYGLGIYQTPGGVEYRGGGRLHPGQAELLPMAAEKPFRPVVMMRGGFGREWPVLLDCTSPSSWLNYGLARSIGAQPVGEHSAKLVKASSDDDVVSCMSLVQSLRFGQLYVERPLVYVRMADGSLGAQARDVEKPAPKGVIGWDILKKFAQIRFDYSSGQVVLVTDQPYKPNPLRLAAALPLVSHAGACAVHGTVNGRSSLILIDPAGDFDLAGAESVRLSEDLNISVAVPAESIGGIRVGLRALEKYSVTVCPQDGMIYFENSADGK